MFIDEGFLKNAKKIASTQPQNSEAKVPAIRRENFDCHIEISVTPYKTDESSDIYRIIKTIKKSVLLKETGNEIITIPDNLKNDTYKIYEFDSDLFKTFDSIYEFCNNMQYISTNIELKLEIKISEVNGSSISVKFEKYGDRYKITKNRLFLYSNYNYSFNSSFIKLCMFLGLYKNGIPFVRWMNRNDIKFLLDINYNRDDLEKLYPVHILNMEKFIDMCVIKKITYMDIDSELAFKSVSPIYGCRTFSEDDMSHLEITYDNIFSDTSKIGADNIIYADTYYDNTYSMYFIDPIYNEGSSCYCYVCIVFELSTEIMNTFLKNELETDITDEIDFSSNIIDPYEYARRNEEMIKQLYYKK